MNNQKLGRLGEDAAAEYLEAMGYRILLRNFRCRAGEIDIIAAKGYNITFIEVKTRQSDLYGRPCESVTQAKKGHIKTAAQYYLTSRPKGAMKPQKLQFDIIEIEINHIRDAF